MRTNKTFQQEELEKMTAQQLDALLQEEIRKDPFNEEVVKQLLDILEEREADMPADDVDVDTAWQEFQAQYAKPAMKDTIAHSSKAPSRWLIRVAAAAAVFCVIVFAAPAAMGAENIFTLIGRWTADIFAFFTPGGANEQQEYEFKTDHPGLQQVYDAVAELGVTERIVPTWLPDGYELIELKVTKQPDKTHVAVVFKADDQYISFFFNIQTEKNPIQYPKNDEEAEIYDYADVEHYILQNHGQSIAAWAAEWIECCITADLEKEELYRVIKSIYTEE